MIIKWSKQLNLKRSGSFINLSARALQSWKKFDHIWMELELKFQAGTWKIVAQFSLGSILLQS